MKTSTCARLTLLSALMLCPVAGGCGGSVQEVRASSAFTEEHSKYFEDGLDFVNDPNTLDGRWRDEWDEEMDTRIELSDLIARVTVEAVRSSWDLDRTQLQLELSIQKRLHGLAPGETVAVSSVEGQPGFSSVKSAEPRILKATYLLFVKWEENDIGQLIPRWHLSPDSDATLALVTSRVTTLHGASSSAH